MGSWIFPVLLQLKFLKSTHLQLKITWLSLRLKYCYHYYYFTTCFSNTERILNIFPHVRKSVRKMIIKCAKMVCQNFGNRNRALFWEFLYHCGKNRIKRPCGLSLSLFPLFFDFIFCAYIHIPLILFYLFYSYFWFVLFIFCIPLLFPFFDL